MGEKQLPETGATWKESGMDETNTDVIEQASETQETETDYKSLYEQEKANAEKWKAMSRKNEQRYKDATSAPAADANEIAKLRNELDTMKHEREVAGWKAAAMEANGLSASDAAWVIGSTQEEINASAAAFKARIDAVPKGADMGNVGGSTAKPISKQDILGIKNEKERLRAIQANIELFH